MADAALEVAKAKMADISYKIGVAEAQISALKAQISESATEWEKLRAFVATWHELAGTQPPVEMSQPVENISQDGDNGKRIRPRNPDRVAVVDACLEIIQEYGSPLNRRDLFYKLADRGMEIQGKDPDMVLSTMLWRTKDRIVRLPGHGYWPSDRIYGPANYDPMFNVSQRVADESEGGLFEETN